MRRGGGEDGGVVYVQLALLFSPPIPSQMAKGISVVGEAEERRGWYSLFLIPYHPLRVLLWAEHLKEKRWMC